MTRPVGVGRPQDVLDDVAVGGPAGPEEEVGGTLPRGQRARRAGSTRFRRAAETPSTLVDEVRPWSDSDAAAARQERAGRSDP